jgi:hypothetical protein
MKEAFVLITGGISEGVTLYGPFKDIQEAARANQNLVIPQCIIGRITGLYDKNSGEIDTNTQKDLFTTAHGNPFDGVELNGLYTSSEEANANGLIRFRGLNSNWQVVAIKNLEKTLEKLKEF